MPPDPHELPPRLVERLGAIDWPETVEEAEDACFVEVALDQTKDRPIRYRHYPEAVKDWPLGVEIVDAILDTVGPSSASILRRRVVLIGGDKGAKQVADVRRLASPQSEVAKADLLFSVDARSALALLAPQSAESTLTRAEARLRLVRLIDRACSIIDEAGRVRRTVANEPSWHVARWGGALTPAAAALVEYGRTLPRVQLTFGDDEGGES